MKKDINQNVIKHIKKLVGANKVEVVKDFSMNLNYEDEKEVYISGDWDNCASIRRYAKQKGESPFYRINKLCIVYNDDSISLISYKSFAIDNDDITFIKDDINYIFKDMSKHIFTNGHKYGYFDGYYIREVDAFYNDNTLYAITYLDEKLHKIDIKGKVIIDTLGGNTFYSIQNNTIYKQSIKTGKLDKYGNYREYNDYVALESNIYYEDEKEITNIEFVDKRYKNDGWITASPNINALIVTFTDGTKKLIVENEQEKKATSRYFKDLKLLIAAVYITKKQFEQEKQENKQSWNYDGDEDYVIPGLTFDYTTDDEQGTFIVKNNGYMKTKSKKKLNQNSQKN